MHTGSVRASGEQAPVTHGMGPHHSSGTLHGTGTLPGCTLCPEIQRDLSDGVPAYTCSREPLIPKASRAHRILRPGCAVGKRRPGSSCSLAHPHASPWGPLTVAAAPSIYPKLVQHPAQSACYCAPRLPPGHRADPLSAPGAFQALLFKGPDASHL